MVILQEKVYNSKLYKVTGRIAKTRPCQAVFVNVEEFVSQEGIEGGDTSIANGCALLNERIHTIHLFLEPVGHAQIHLVVILVQ